MPHSELHHQRDHRPVFELAQVRSKTGNHGTQRSRIAARRRDPTCSGEIRDIRAAMDVLPAERDVLAGHIVKRRGGVPGLEWIAWVLREIWSSRKCGCAVDGWQKYEVPSWV